MERSRPGLARGPKGLTRLARLYGVQASFRDTEGRRVYASPETVLAILKAMRVPVENASDIEAAVREREARMAGSVLEPVYVAWDSAEPTVAVWLPQMATSLTYEVELESGERRSGTARPSELPVAPSRQDGRVPPQRLLRLPALPFGYHRLRVAAGGREQEARLVSAPRRTFAPAEGRRWGAFLPLYALRRRDDGAVGDYGDLRALIDWTAGAGGGAVGTLPLLATFLSHPFEPSPYAPASRLVWNELYIDLEEMLSRWPCDDASALLRSPAFREEEKRLAASTLVNYEEAYRSRRMVIQRAADCLAERDRAVLEDYAREQPEAEAYARFRAVGERQKSGWRQWPEPLRNGVLPDGSFDEANRRFHLFCQMEAARQLGAVAQAAAAKAVSLYLDFPLGVHPDGYDVWRQRDLFAEGASAGAPPDTFFTRGQDWGFRPLLPDQLRESGYDQWAHWLRHSMRVAQMLRVDHVMGLHRLYWVPRGHAATEGAYVRYPAEEMYAVLSLESHRTATVVIGEDLGTVPAYVRASMRRHGVSRTYVLQLEAGPDRQPALPAVPREAVASLNTHDLPPFAAFWRGTDIEDRSELGHMTEPQAAAERLLRDRQRAAIVAYLQEQGFLAPGVADERSVLDACLQFMAESPAHLLLVNLEDMWLETEPQNMPGTSTERPNWRRRARLTLEDIERRDEVQATLDAVRRMQP